MLRMVVQHRRDSERDCHAFLYLSRWVLSQVPPYDNPPTQLTTPTRSRRMSAGSRGPFSGEHRGRGCAFGLITNLTTNRVPADYGMRSAVYADAASLR